MRAAQSRPSTYWRARDARPDGSCFFRAVYQAARQANLLDPLVSCFGRHLRIRRLGTAVSEDLFVQLFRKTMASLVRFGRDGGAVVHFSSWAEQVLRASTEKTLSERASRFSTEYGFPAAYGWLLAWAFRKSEPTVALRAAIAWHLEQTDQFVGPVEVELARYVLSKCLAGRRYRFEILTPRDWIRRSWVPHPNDMILLNLHEAHYNWVEFL